MALEFACIMRLDDVGMIQFSNGTHLSFEPRDHIGVVESVVRQDFDRNKLVQLCMQGLVDRTHAALPKFLQDSVFTDRLNWQSRRVGGALSCVLRRIADQFLDP